MAIINANNAESLAKRWLINKFGNDLLKFRISRVWKQIDLYIVNCRAEIRKGIFSSELRNLSLQIDLEGEDILGYSEDIPSNK